MAGIYIQQVKANKTFFENGRQVGHFQELAEEDWPERFEDVQRVYDITGFNASTVVALLSEIVNSWAEKQTFYFLIKVQSYGWVRHTETYRLTALPLDDEPGNGRIEMKERGTSRFNSSAYDVLNERLEADYKLTPTQASHTTCSRNTNTPDARRFANDMLRLFQNNGMIHTVPASTAETYLLLLFEIARRLVKREEDKEKKFRKTVRGSMLDALPIGSAIARALMLFEQDEGFSFSDFFLPKLSNCHCFSQSRPTVRKNAIDRLNTKFSSRAVSNKKPLDELRCTFGDPRVTVLAVAAEAPKEAAEKAKEARERVAKAATEITKAAGAEEIITAARHMKEEMDRAEDAAMMAITEEINALKATAKSAMVASAAADAGTEAKVRILLEQLKFQ